MRLRLIILFLLISNCVNSQAVITGKVYLAGTGSPVQSLNVTLHEQSEGPVKVFSVTANDGSYRLEYTGSAQHVFIAVSGINVERAIRSVSNTTQTLDIHVHEKVTEIKEIAIKSPKITQRGDTLNYRVSAFTDVGDRTIADVMRKLPGIEVSESGEIRYQNKAINKFYIEDLDLLQGRYGIATSNIEAKDVEVVQVLENHQPIRALKDLEFVDEAAINLKLKESAKGVLIANAQGGIGASPLLLSNELTAMNFSRNGQYLGMYKGDNTGRDVGNELNMLYKNPRAGNDRSRILSIVSPSSPAISHQRYFFNDAHLVSLNNLSKIGKLHTITTNVNYLFDRIDAKSNSEYEYYLPQDNILRISESTRSRRYKNGLKANINIEANTDDYYFRNDLSLNGEWDRRKGTSTASDTISQYLKEPVREISNSLELIKKRKDKTLKFSSNTSYTDSEQTLSVIPLLYPDYFGYEQDGDRLVQDFSLRSFTTFNSIAWNNKMGKFDLDLKAEINETIQNMQSDLSLFSEGAGATGDSLRNDIKRNQTEILFSPTLRYNPSQRLRTSFGIPVSYLYTYGKDRIRRDGDHDNYLFLNPFVTVHYRLTARLMLNAHYNLRHSTGSINDIYSGIVMRSYRTLSRNDGQENSSRSNNIFFDLNYRDPISTLFGFWSVNFSNVRSGLLYDYYYDGILQVDSYIKHPHNSNNVTSAIRLGKDIPSLSASVAIGGSAGYNSSEVIVMGEVADYSSRFINLSPSFRKNFRKIAVFDYRITAGITKSTVNTTASELSKIKSVSQEAKFSITPLGNLTVNVSFQHYFNNLIRSGSRSIWFGNAGVRYKLPKVDIMLDYTNIFNTRTYYSVTYDEAARYMYSYRLRPTEILARVRFKLF